MREGRARDELRPLEIVPDFLDQAHGSALISFGKTRVLCTATIDDGVPRWLAGRGQGWLTAEYGMLPGSTGSRTPREASAGKQKGRTVEIQRLIGRSLRAAYDMKALGERTVWLDCDVIQADGGTRTAAISGVWVALALAARRLGLPPPRDGVAAVSVGIVDGEALLDLDYVEDVGAEVDMNVVMTGDGRLIEVQATAEKTPFTRAGLDELVDLAAAGIAEIADRQRRAVGAMRVLAGVLGQRREAAGAAAPAPRLAPRAASHGRHRRRDGSDLRGERPREGRVGPPARGSRRCGPRRGLRARSRRLGRCARNSLGPLRGPECERSAQPRTAPRRAGGRTPGREARPLRLRARSHRAGRHGARRSWNARGLDRHCRIGLGGLRVRPRFRPYR